ncbi:uncharacterized protein LOC105257081 [Camponotus floridanus]|uniref:uncharacterized protein LOC105257081 n=1 Tax=Camponotus floridanus TaxID=104421 RepID=UPI000DC67B3E|nr:uncharacterized protein LOC105257081 [Camponotus floridanus]
MRLFSVTDATSNKENVPPIVGQEVVINTQDGGRKDDSNLTPTSEQDDPEHDGLVDILNLLGEDPTASKENAVKLHPEVVNRWKEIMKFSLPEQAKKVLLKKFPRTGELYTQPPKINVEIIPAMTEISKKRDQHFTDTQECVGTAITSLAAAVSLLLEDSEEGVDQIKLIEYLSDTGKLLIDVFRQHSKARASFITPIMKKSVKPLVDSLSPGEWLFGDKLADQIKEVKTVESACNSLKAVHKVTKKPLQRSQENWRGPSAQYRQTGGYYKKPFLRFKSRTQYRSNQTSREKSKPSKESSKK